MADGTTQCAISLSWWCMSYTILDQSCKMVWDGLSQTYRRGDELNLREFQWSTKRDSTTHTSIELVMHSRYCIRAILCSKTIHRTVDELNCVDCDEWKLRTCGLHATSGKRRLIYSNPTHVALHHLLGSRLPRPRKLDHHFHLTSTRLPPKSTKCKLPLLFLTPGLHAHTNTNQKTTMMRSQPFKYIFRKSRMRLILRNTFMEFLM